MKRQDQSGRLSFFCTLLFLVLPAAASAQGVIPDTQYSAVFKGQIYFTDRQPSTQEIVEQSTLTIKRDGNSISIVVGQIGSAMSATRFAGTVGNSAFTAVHTSPTQPGQVKVLWGRIENRQIEGSLLYSRVGDGLVPGYTELHFQGSIGATQPGSGSIGKRTLMPGTANRAPRAPVPASDTTDTTPKPSKVLKPRVSEPAASASSGNSVISGTITGDIDVVYDVQLVDEDENTLQSQTLDSNGRYRFEKLGPGRYWIYVNDRRAEAYIRTTRGNREVNADGRSTYRVDFDVEN